MTPPPRPYEPCRERQVPGRAFPPYRHGPGVTPHPRRDPRGHSFGADEPGAPAPLEASSWTSNETYLFGVDLYNFAYWWEAHEQWEALWRLAGAATDTGVFLQGLIQVSAALLKWHGGKRRGFVGLSAKGCDRLTRVAGRLDGAAYMGLALAPFVAAFQEFGAHQQMIWPARRGLPPALDLR